MNLQGVVLISILLSEPSDIASQLLKLKEEWRLESDVTGTLTGV